MHVFGPGEETGVPGENPRGTGRTCKLHTHGGGGNRTPNLGELILHRASGNLEPIPRDSGHKMGDTLDLVPTQSHNHSLTTDNLKMLISLQGMSLDWGRNQRTQRKSLKH
ncbi:hypothetical protein QTP86_025322 [Hemibagrus guttatus]|nr:hypothetical protein QTP86_025322 [Hemibagrus guttatus]